MPDLLEKLGRILPAEARGKSVDQTEAVLRENRDYLRFEGEGFEIDAFARRLGIANYRRELLERCIENLRGGRDVEESVAALVRYTGQRLGTSAASWGRWRCSHHI